MKDSLKNKKVRAVVRQWRLIRRLTVAPATVAELRAHLSCSRATLYRDLAILTEAGFRIESNTPTPGGEAVYTLASGPE